VLREHGALTLPELVCLTAAVGAFDLSSADRVWVANQRAASSFGTGAYGTAGVGAGGHYAQKAMPPPRPWCAQR
jgi:hypothetical protein